MSHDPHKKQRSSPSKKNYKKYYKHPYENFQYPNSNQTSPSEKYYSRGGQESSEYFHKPKKSNQTRPKKNHHYSREKGNAYTHTMDQKKTVDVNYSEESAELHRQK